MIVRQLDSDKDWTFGKGKNNYLKDLKALEQTLETRLKSFLGDCPFALGEGIDYFNLIGSKNQLELNLSIQTKILNTEGVTGVLLLSANLDTERVYTPSYTVQTIYGLVQNQFSLDLSPIQ